MAEWGLSYMLRRRGYRGGLAGRKILSFGTFVNRSSTMRCVPSKIAFGLACAMIVPMLALYGAENSKTNTTKTPATPIDLFAGMESGDLQVKFIPKNDREASLLIQNKTNQPLSVVLPDAFVGAPILAQAAPANGGMANRNRTTTNNSNNNQNQTVGGGGGGFGGGGGGGGFGGGGGGFNVAPEAVGKLKMQIVCLEHGKQDPAAHIPYEIRPVESFSKDPQVKELLTVLGQGQLDQQAAQAAAWHFANGMSWDELAAKKIHHLGGRPDEQYFSPGEIQKAMRIASQVVQLAKDLPPADDSHKSAKSDADRSLSSAFQSPGEK
jgi:hypothetical protein